MIIAKRFSISESGNDTALVGFDLYCSSIVDLSTHAVSIIALYDKVGTLKKEDLAIRLEQDSEGALSINSSIELQWSDAAEIDPMWYC